MQNLLFARGLHLGAWAECAVACREGCMTGRKKPCGRYRSDLRGGDVGASETKALAKRAVSNASSTADSVAMFAGFRSDGLLLAIAP
jgi:hypothetical protein